VRRHRRITAIRPGGYNSRQAVTFLNQQVVMVSEKAS